MKLGATKKEISVEEESDIITFGKYNGYKISNLDTSYLTFLLKKCEWISDSLRDKLITELNKRKEEMPCFGILYDPISKTCGACSFIEECSNICYVNN